MLCDRKPGISAEIISRSSCKMGTRGRVYSFLAFVSIISVLHMRKFEYPGNDNLAKLSEHSTSKRSDENIPKNQTNAREITLPWDEDQRQRLEVCVKDCATGKSVGECLKYESVEELSVPRDTVSKETGEHRQDAFRDIYVTAQWSKHTQSGPGSTLDKTQRIRTVLDQVISDIKVALNKTTIDMLDVPCGDLTWMRQFLASRTDISYTGVDIVAELISKHDTEFTNDPGMRFLHKDIASEPLDKPYDLIFSRYMTQHLTNYDTLRALITFSQSHSSYLMITNFLLSRNHDLNIEAAYRHRRQNLEIPPYSLSPPICQSYDGDDVMALWRLPLKRVANCTLGDILKVNRANNDFFACNPKTKTRN